MKKINIIAGARPNFIKIAPLIEELRNHPTFEYRLVHTGQHYDEKMSKVFFEELEIPRPDINLEVGSHPREEQIRLISESYENLVKQDKPDAVVVVGDVNSTVACARVAKKFSIKVIHVEAGLRSFDASMPEEVNRIETDRLSDLLFVTEKDGVKNLSNEKVEGKVFLVGNVMIDTLVRFLKKAGDSPVLERLNISPGEYIISTFHRPSNVDSEESLEKLVRIISEICSRTKLVLPLHPRTSANIRKLGLDSKISSLSNLILTEPLGYLDFLKLVSESRAVITDSGGIQEEATYLKVPCLTMRENTERPITIEVGSNTLVGTDEKKLVSLLDDILAGRYKQGEIPELWDGAAAKRIVNILQSELGA